MFYFYFRFLSAFGRWLLAIGLVVAKPRANSQEPIVLSHHHLLNLNVITVDEADHVDARGDVELALVAAAEGVARDHVAEDVDDLDGSLTLDAEDAEVAHAVDEAEAVAVGAGAGGEDQLEALGEVGDLCVEGVARVGKQVYVVAGEVIDEVQVAEADFL